MKRKIDSSEDKEVSRKHPAVRCILHVGVTFTPVSNVKGFAIEKLSQLHNIRQRRLMEPRVSPYRMEDVCNQIPEALAGVNLEAVGRRRGCYQRFTKNQDSLRGSVNTS